MAIRFIKSKQDIYEVFKDQAGNINPGITGEVYTNLENLGTAGEKRMYQLQKEGALSTVEILERAASTIRQSGQNCAIEYDEKNNKFTIIATDSSIKTEKDLEAAKMAYKNNKSKGTNKYSQATFDIVDATGQNYGKISNNPMVIHDAKGHGGKGNAVMVPRFSAELKQFADRMQDKYKKNIHLKTNVKKGVLESARSYARLRVNEVYNDKSRGAASEFFDEQTLAGFGDEFAVENYINSRKIVVTQLLNSLKYAYKVDDYYNKLMWGMMARIAQAEDREAAIKQIEGSSTYKNLLGNVGRSGFLSMAREMKQWADDYHAEDIDWKHVNEGGVDTGILAAWKSSAKVGQSGNRYAPARVQTTQQLLHRAQKDEGESIFHHAVYKSSEAEKKAGIKRGRSVKQGEYVPFDAVVMGLEVNALDEAVAKTHTLDDNIGVSSQLLREIAGERVVTTMIKPDKAKDRLNGIIRKLSKNKKRKFEMDNGRYWTNTSKNSSGELFSVLSGGETDFDKLSPELQQIVLEEAWRQDIARKGRDVKLADEALNNIRFEKMDNGGYIIRGTEIVRPRQGDKGLAVGANMKGSMEIMDDSLKQYGSQYQFLVAQKKGDVRKFGANYIDPDLNALLYEYGSSVGLHSDKGLLGLKKTLEGITNRKTEKESTVAAAKAILQSYEFSKDGVIRTNSVMDVLQELEPEKRAEALKELLPLIDRLINGIDQNNRLMTQKKFESMDDSQRYYTRATDDEGNEVLIRTGKAKRLFANVHKANEFRWSGANMYAGRESVRRSAGLTAAEEGRTDAEIQEIKTGTEELYKRLDISEKKRDEFNTLKNNAEYAVDLTNQTTGGVKSGLIEGTNQYAVVIGKNVDPNDIYAIDASKISEAQYEGDTLLNEDEVLQGVMKSKLAELAAKGIDASNVNFIIDTGTNFGGVTQNGKTWGGRGVAIAKGTTLDSEKGFENYAREAQRLVNMINDGDVEEEKIAEQAKTVMLSTLQDFQNKGAVYERYFGGKTKGVQAGKVLPMAAQWLMNAMLEGPAAKNLSGLEKWQGEMATSGAFITESMFNESVKKADKKELLELYNQFYKGTSLEEDMSKASKTKLIKAIKEAVTYSDDANSIFGQLLSAGKLESGLQGLASRFPFSNGLDVKSIRKVFIDPRLNVDGEKSNAMRLGFGLSKMFNADFDGDVAEMLLGTKFTKTEKAAVEAVGKSEENVAKKLAYFTYKDMVKDAGYQIDKLTGQYTKKDKGGVKVLDEATVKNIFDSNLAMISATGMRYAKDNTGKLSNLATEFRNMMNAQGFDESALLDADTDEKRSTVAKTMMGRAFLEQMEQDAISSKKVIERMIKAKTGKDASTMNKEELYNSYYAAIEDVDSILDDFYSGKVNFGDLTKKLSTIGVLGSEGELESGRVLKQYLERIVHLKNGEDLIAGLFGVDKKDLDFVNKDADNYYLNKALSSAQMGNIFNEVAVSAGYSTSKQLFQALPKKEYSPEKKTVKEYNLATEDVKKADAAWLEHIKTLNNAEAASVSEANAESRKIIIAGKEADAIRLLGAEYQNLSDILGEVSKSKDELAEELLNVDKNQYPALGVTGQLHKQFGATFPDDSTGFGKSLSDFAKTGKIYINGAEYSLKDFKAGFPQDRKDRVWLDSTGKEVKNKTLIGTLNRLGYSKEDFDKSTQSFGALTYGTLAHRTSEILGILGISENELKTNKIKGWKSLGSYIENRISELEKSSDASQKARGSAAREKWNQGFDDRGYGGSWSHYIDEYDKALKLIGLDEKEREAKINEKVMIGRNYHNLVTMGNNPRYRVLYENAVGIPSGAQRRVSDIDALTQDTETGETYISDYKTKSGKIKDYELAQILKYQFGIQSLASAAYNNADLQAALKDVDTFKNSTFYNDLGFDDNRPITQEMLEVVKNIVAKAGERFKAKVGREGSDEEVRDFIYSMVKARLIRGDEKSGESFYLSDAISANKISDSRLAGIVQAIMKEGELSEDDRAYFYKHAFVKGYGLYDRWGDGTSSTTATGKGGRGSKKADAEAQKEYNTLISEELNLKKQLIDAEIELQKLKNVEGKTVENQDVKDKEAEINFLKDELDYNQKRKKKLIKGGAKEDAAKTAADDEKLSYYARMRGYDIKNTSVGGIEGGVKNIDNLTPEEQADYWSQYERALDKQARAKEEIAGLRNKAVTTTYHTEKDLLYQIADAKERGLAADNANVAMLEKIVGKLDPTRLANIKEQVALNQQLYKLQALKQTRGATSIWDMMANDIRRATMRIADFGVAAKILNKIPQDIQKVIQYTKELDAAMTNIRIVSGKSMEEAQEFMRGLQQIAQKTGTTLSELASAANEWLRQGYESTEEIEELLDASTKLSKLGMIPASESVKLLTSSLKGMKLSANEAISVVDKLTKLDMKSATSAQELAQALSKVANSARLAKVSQDEILGILSVGIETTQQSGDVIGTAVRSLLARFSNVKASKFSGSGEETEGTLNDTEAVLSKIGIRIRNASGEMRSFMDVLDDVAEKWDTLDDVSRNAISTAMAGTRQKEIFASIIENYDRVKELTEESANAAGTADEKYSAYMDSMEAATKRLQNAWEGFTQSLETSTVMKFLTNKTALLVENADKLKYLVTYIAAAGSAKIFDFFTNKGETGGFKGLIANIPFIGRGTKTNNILESIDKKVGNIEKGVGADSLVNQTKNGGLFKRIGSFLKNGFGFGDIYDPNSDTSISRKTLKLYKQSQKGKIRLGDDFLGYTKGLTDDERELLRLSATVGQEDAKKMMETYNKLLKQRKRQNAAMGAASAVLTNLFTTKQVGGDIGGFLMKNIMGMGDNEQAVEETTGDKIRRTLFSGGLAAAGGALLGPLGAMLGQTLGEGFASMFATWYHRDELAMKQRVAEAKENLSALGDIKTAIENNEDLLSKDAYTSEDYEKLKTYTDSLRKTFTNNDDLAKSFLDDVNDLDIGTFTTIEDILSQITKGNADINKQLKKQLELTTARLTVEETLGEQEDDRAKIESQIGKDIKEEVSSGMETRRVANLETTMRRGGNVRDLIYDTYISPKNIGLYEQLKKEGLIDFSTNKYQLTAASGSTTYSEYIKSLSIAGNSIVEQLDNAKKVLEKVGSTEGGDLAQKWEKVVDEYQKQVNKQTELNNELLSTQVDYAYLTSDILNTKSRDEIRELGMEGVVKIIRDELISQGVGVVDKNGVIHQDAYDAIVKKIRSDSTLSDYITKDIRSIGDLISKDDIRGIESFARAFGLTTEAAKELGKQFGYLTQSMGLMNVQETTEYYEKLSTVFSNLSSNVALTAEQINSLLTTSELKDLLPYLMNQDDPDALIKELYKRIYGGGQDVHMENALYDATMGMSTDKFREYLQNKGLKEYVAEIDKGGYTTLSQIRDVVKEFDETDPRRQAFLEYLETINYTYSKDLTALEKPSEYIKSQLEEQINNLQEQKDALSQINDEREKELNLIKAKQALEDARKEKRRVYRAGVGFSYESNEEAIAEAQKNLENLNTQKRQEDLQAQIDALQMQKNIIEALPNQAQLEQTKKIWELWAADKGTKGSLASVTEGVTMLADAYTNATKEMNVASKTLEKWNTPGEESGQKTSEEKTNPLIKLSESQIEYTKALVGTVEDILALMLSSDDNADQFLKIYNLIKGLDDFGAASDFDQFLVVQGLYTTFNKLSDKAQTFLRSIAPKKAIGDISFQGGKALINELGTEAVITPGGTLTALPSKTGIVPADITRNIWALGEVAPTLVAQLGSLTQKTLSGNAGNTTYEEGQYFDNFTMNVYPAKGDDFNKILEQARAQMRLTRHNN